MLFERLGKSYLILSSRYFYFLLDLAFLLARAGTIGLSVYTFWFGLGQVPDVNIAFKLAPLGILTLLQVKLIIYFIITSHSFKYFFSSGLPTTLFVTVPSEIANTGLQYRWQFLLLKFARPNRFICCIWFILILNFISRDFHSKRKKPKLARKRWRKIRMSARVKSVIFLRSIKTQKKPKLSDKGSNSAKVLYKVLGKCVMICWSANYGSPHRPQDAPFHILHGKLNLENSIYASTWRPNDVSQHKKYHLQYRQDKTDSRSTNHKLKQWKNQLSIVIKNPLLFMPVLFFHEWPNNILAWLGQRLSPVRT